MMHIIKNIEFMLINQSMLSYTTIVDNYDNPNN